ncbi:ParA family protein [Thalassobaculum litoreum]|uniref:Chromosome partitioning protein n=1 Tax=Thalassobaculum litoreum DSM 18839 TaxID=1123362 RepID=A0A8G2F0T6_9PROT|nr:ParA family protein [Thalassobaculum litoreum]SDG58228.1 chromosome partitioning protein [Thalassobaculum litoreum DSM 18839]
MPIISIANSKGGAGKTTLCLVLAQAIADAGKRVLILDADPNRPIQTWASRLNDRGTSALSQLSVDGDVTESNIVDKIDAARETNDFVLIDLEGTASVAVSYAVGQSDFVLIPLQGSQLDADQAARVIGLIRQNAKAYRREIPFGVIFTRVNPAIKPRDLAHIEQALAENKIPVFETRLYERAAFRSIFQVGMTLQELTPAIVSRPEVAVENALAVAQELIDRLAGEIRDVA